MSTILQVRSEHPNGSTDFCDISNSRRPATVAGNAAHTTDYSFFSGKSSIRLSSSTDYVQFDFASSITSADFTAEYHCHPIGSAGIAWADSAGTFSLAVVLQSARLRVYLKNIEIITGSTVLSSATSYHVELSRNGSLYRLFLDGVIEGYATNNTVFSATRFMLGYGDGGNDFAEIRVSDICLHTTDFTPPGWLTVPTYIGPSFASTVMSLSPQLYVEFSEISGDLCADTSGNALNLTAHGTYTRNIASLCPSQTSDPAIFVGDYSGLMTTNTTDILATSFTMACALKCASVRYSFFFHKGDNTNAEARGVLIGFDPNGYLKVYIHRSGSWYTEQCQEALMSGVTYFIRVGYSEAASHLKVWVNERVLLDKTTTQVLSDTSNDTPVVFANYNQGGTYPEVASFYLDNCCVFPGLLTPEQAHILYQSWLVGGSGSTFEESLTGVFNLPGTPGSLFLGKNFIMDTTAFSEALASVIPGAPEFLTDTLDFLDALSVTLAWNEHIINDLDCMEAINTIFTGYTTLVDGVDILGSPFIGVFEAFIEQLAINGALSGLITHVVHLTQTLSCIEQVLASVRIRVHVSENLAYTQATLAQQINNIAERLALLVQVDTRADVSSEIADSLHLSQALKPVFAMALLEHILMSSTGLAQKESLGALRDSLIMHLSQTTSVIFWQTLLETLRTAATFKNLDLEIIRDIIALVTDVLTVLRVRETLHEVVNILQSQTPHLIFLQPLDDTLEIDQVTSLSYLIHGFISNNVDVHVSAPIVADEYTTMCLNPTNYAVWKYSNYNFDSACVANGITFLANKEGLFKVSGDRDGSAFIKGTVTLPALDLGTSAIKSMSEVYLGTTTNGTIILKITLDNQVTVYYEATVSNEQLRSKFINIGKGLKSRYWTFELQTKNLTKFDLDEIEFYSLDYGRRVR